MAKQARQPRAIKPRDPKTILVRFLQDIAVAAGRAAVLAACEETARRLRGSTSKPTRRRRS